MEPIAIIGSGCRFPGGVNTPHELWELLREPRDVLSSLNSRFSSNGFYHQRRQYHGHSNVSSAYLLAGEGIHRQFDSRFFGMSPVEAHDTDPQSRLLLETVFEAIENAGQTMDALKGSDTAVYVGMMCNDYEHIASRDGDFLGAYHATGTSRAIMSNRISYFFDWHGPSITIDTACSSSLYAVHYAVQQLRSGASKVAVAAGSNLLLEPRPFVAEGNLQMLSPDGRSRMWDVDADGYARGEGVAAIVLKKLSLAEADGDPIECIIRETAVNQDGRTKGITKPSADAQACMIRDCYNRAGINLDNWEELPQYFEAHGTGTPAGDPIEAEAIHSALLLTAKNPQHPLFVGSIKTVVGHTEGTAGLAGIMKVSLALQNSMIPANLLFNRLNPSIEPFYGGLQIPISTQSWPNVPTGSSRRASVNSFGFGGANAHAILEGYSPSEARPTELGDAACCPFIFSAASAVSLSRYLERFAAFVNTHSVVLNMRDLAYTLNSRRTRLQYACAVSARTVDELASGIEEKMKSQTPMRASRVDGQQPRVLAVFTGQGAQWPRMGAELLASSKSARNVVEKLDTALSRLPPDHRPSWSLLGELERNETSSRINEAALSQPICTAVQIVLVDLIRACGLELSASVGHSSGEIAAAYASGFISAEDAICIAYYRGVVARKALGPGGRKGSMLAVGTSFTDAQELLDEPEFRGRACVAAINSTASVTLSGDSDAVEELDMVFQDEGKFTRKLKVDKAYHSHHMLPCSAPYLKLLKERNIQVRRPNTHNIWFSSVLEDEDTSEIRQDLGAEYWDRNMGNPVLFAQAIERACVQGGPFDIAVEIGPHPALKGPVVQTVQETLGSVIPYIGLLRRKSDSLRSIADGLSFVSMHLGSGIDFSAYDRYIFGPTKLRVVQGLPPYAWDHELEFWHESRLARAVRMRPDFAHELLGHVCPDSTENAMRWRHVLIPKEIPWLEGHQLQNQIVFPAAGYIVTALEASLSLSKGLPISFIEINDLNINQAITFDSSDSAVEVVFALTETRTDSNGTHAMFHYYADSGKGHDRLESVAGGSIYISFGDVSPTALPTREPRQSNLFKVRSDDFYQSLSRLEYQYTGPFAGLSGLERKLGIATGFISNPEGSSSLVHPAMLDMAFQTVFLAASAPDDGELRSMHVPSTIRRVRINPELFKAETSREGLLAFDTITPNKTEPLSGDIVIFPPDVGYAMLQVEGLNCVPLSPPKEDNDRAMFSTTVWGMASPDVDAAMFDATVTEDEDELALHLERLASFYLRELERKIPVDHPCKHGRIYATLFNNPMQAAEEEYIKSVSLSRGWANDTTETFKHASIHSESVDAQLIQKIGENLPQIVLDEVPGTSVGIDDGLLRDFHQEGLGIRDYNTYLARVLKQIVHRSPRVHCLQIGCGIGSASNTLLREIGDVISSFTFTDSSPHGIEAARATLKGQGKRMIFKDLEISQDVEKQGFLEGSYDVIISSVSLYAAPSLTQALRNMRRLLRPGGSLVVVEMQQYVPAHMRIIMSYMMTRNQNATDTEQGQAIFYSQAMWDSLLKKTGFSGIDTISRSQSFFVKPFTLLVAQASNEEVNFLRNPLSHLDCPSMPPTQKIFADLVLLGGEGSQTCKLVTELKDMLQQYCSSIKVCTALSGLHQLSLSGRTTILSLVELDDPIFSVIDETKWENLKLLLRETGTLLWISCGRRGLAPYANAMIGLIRTAMHEFPGHDFQTLDAENANDLDAMTIGAALLRFRAATLWHQQDPEKWPRTTIENELVIDKQGRLVIPRLIPDRAMNDRYNSSQRTITTRNHSENYVLTLGPVDNGYCLQRVALQECQIDMTGLRVIIEYSLLSAVRVAANSFMFLSFGTDINSKAKYINLSTHNNSIISPDAAVAAPSTIPVGSEAKFLYLLGIQIIITEILSGLEPSDTVLVHNPDVSFVTALKSKLKERSINAIFTTDCNVKDEVCLNIHPNTPERRLRRFGFDSATVFLDLSLVPSRTGITERIRSCLNPICRCETMATMRSRNSHGFSSVRQSKIRSSLNKAVASATKAFLNLASIELHHQVLSVKEICERDNASPFSLVHWRQLDQLAIRVRPIQEQLMFSNSKTYWLAGLTGTLGLSLCMFLIHHGARYIALSSRSANVSQVWLKEMADEGAVIRLFKCDMTNKSEVVATRDQIHSTMPHVGGVAHGASKIEQPFSEVQTLIKDFILIIVVLHDVRVDEMSFETLMKVTRPKIDGSRYLNDLFQEDTLEFFILFSSVSSIIGAQGQAHYNAANTFMASLAEQRRRLGLAGSVINIGPIIGVGYIAEHGFDYSILTDYQACRPTSEGDFHQIFAEGVVAGRSASKSPLEITTGVKQIYLDNDARPKWASNPLFSHHILHGEANHSIFASTKSKASLKVQLAGARSRTEVRELVAGHLWEALKSLLQLGAGVDNQSGSDAIRLDELGVDSLTAVEIRGWFMRNLRVNYPVLRILNGATVGQLIEAGVEGIDTTLIPRICHPVSSAADEAATVTVETLAEDSPNRSDRDSSLSQPSGQSWLHFNSSDISGPDSKPSAWLEPSALESLELSVTQTMFWFASKLFEDEASLNHTVAFQLSGLLDVQKFEAAVRSVGQQHESLRTSFRVADGKATQNIMAASRLRLVHRAIINESEVAQMVKDVQRRPYNIADGETARVVLLSLSPENHFLVFGGITLVMDGMCFPVFLGDVLRHYKGRPESRPTPQYREFFTSRTNSTIGSRSDKQLEFWRKKYVNFPPPLPILRVSSVKSRSSLSSFDHDNVTLRIMPPTKMKIRTICRKLRVTPFHFYLACFRVLLSRYADLDDISIGIADANRTEDRMRDTIGVFVNLLPLRFGVSADSIFEDVLQDTRNVVYEAQEHSQLPFQVLLDKLEPPRSVTHTPLFQCFVDYRYSPDTWGDIDLNMLSFEGAKTGYDLNLDIIDSTNGDCALILDVRTDLYDQKGAEMVLASYRTIIEAFAETPNMSTSKPSLYSYDGIEKALFLSKGPSLLSQWPSTVAHQVDDIAAAVPNHVAIRSGQGTHTTYSELMELTNTIAFALLAAGAAVSSRVAVLQEPTQHWVASLLAVMRIGAVYIPLDLSTPWTRLAAIVNSCDARLALVDEKTVHNVHKLRKPGLVSLDVSRMQPGQPKCPNEAVASGQAMILHTSGSTGLPKGIVLRHDGIRNQLELYGETYGIGLEVVLQQSACSFDHSYAQIFVALCYGGSVYLLPRRLRTDPRAISEIIEREHITHTIATPTEYFSWLKYGSSAKLKASKWRTAHSAGENLTSVLMQQFKYLGKPQLRLFNAYGPTENCLNATAMELDYFDEKLWLTGIAAGHVLPNYSVYILDEQRNPVPPGIQGEIYIGGAGVAAGYINDPKLTAAKFLDDCFASDCSKVKGWTKMHRSGDLGRWSKDGILLIEGRISGDTQIKIRGIRVDLQEIEQAVLEVAKGGISEAVVSLRRASPDSPDFLIGHVVLDKDQEKRADDHTDFLQATISSLALPNYMRPAALIPIRCLPVTSTGKLDRKTLAEMPLPKAIQQLRGSDDMSILTDTEIQLRDIWTEVIQERLRSLHVVTSETDFFIVGGTSLLLLELHDRIQARFSTCISVAKLLASSTLAGMAHVIDERRPMETVIDWEKETALTSQMLGFHQPIVQHNRHHFKLVVVLTGATGHLGRAILDTLIADDQIARIHCIAIRNAANRPSMKELSKVHIYEGDLRLRRLGLSEDAVSSIFSEADCIIHNGAEVSHLQSYNSLRIPNTQSTKELIEMSLPRRIPIHYISSLSAGLFNTDGFDAANRVVPETSLAAHEPPSTGTFGGYAASKWASERFLERLHHQLGWPVFVHRPALISRGIDTPASDILHNIRFFSIRMGAVPMSPAFSDTFSVVDPQDVASSVANALHLSDSNSPGLRFSNYCGKVNYSFKDLQTWISHNPTMNHDAGETVVAKAPSQPLEILPLDEWATRARDNGMDPALALLLQS